MTKLHKLAELGQSVWLDYISRPLIVSGELRKLVGKGLRGVTSNPTIFKRAIAGNTEYNEDLKRLVEKGKTVHEICESLDRFKEIFSSKGWKKLAARGAKVQRPLWASTSTKNPSYPDTLYVDKLIGADTVNTLPPNTLDAFLDHGNVTSTLESDVRGARSRISKLDRLGIDFDAITRQVLEDGVKSFAESFDALLASIAEKQEKMLWDWQQPSAGFGPTP